MQESIIRAIQMLRSPLMDGLFQAVTMMGEEIFFILSLTLTYWCINKRLGYRIGIALISSSTLNTALKEVFHAARPIGLEGIFSLRIHTATGYSFPSGHTQSAASFWFSFMIWVKKKWFYVTGSIIILLVALSRLYLGVHWPADVIAGIVVAAIWVFIVGKLFDKVKKGNPYVLLWIVIPALVGLIFFPKDSYYKMTGTTVGLFLGLIIESKHIHHETHAKLLHQIIKMFVGIAVLIGLKVLVKQLLPVGLFSDFIRYTSIGFWVTAGAPWVFKMLGLGDKHSVPCH